MKQSKHLGISNIPRCMVVGLILVYQYVLSPMKNALFGVGGCCRFYPTCSAYTIESVKVHGALKGLFYSLMRIGKCQPFHRGGFDPVKPVTPRHKPLLERESLLDVSSQS